MWFVICSLIPTGAWGAWAFGVNALLVMVAGGASALLTEAAIQAVRKREITISDGSALLTGLLLAYNLPPDVPTWIPIVGSFFAVAIGKQVFGGLGHNIFNPALVGRAFLLASWPVAMTTWSNPRWHADAVTGASPLGIVKESGSQAIASYSALDLLIGNKPGCIGEVCVIALLAGAAFLLWKKYISLRIPVSFIGTVALLSWMFNGVGGLFTGDVLFFTLSGGLVLGAFFMATDYVTSPLTTSGQLIFGVSCGLLTFIIRKFSGYPEGVSYAILMMNAFVPLIDRYTFPRWFGQAKVARKK